MKTIVNLILAVTALFLTINLLFPACAGDVRSDEGLNDDSLDLNQILHRYNEGKLPDNQGELYGGTILAGNLRDDEIAFFIRSDDSRANHHYLLQLSGKASFPTQTLSHAQILYCREFLYVNAGAQELLCYAGNRPEYFKNHHFTAEFQGFGLSRGVMPNFYQQGVAFLNNPESANAPDRASACICLADWMDPQGLCESGGPGATQCGVTQYSFSSGHVESCNVVCTGPTYACCAVW